MSRPSNSRVSDRNPMGPRTPESVTASEYSRTSGNSHVRSESGHSRRSGVSTTLPSEQVPVTRSRLSQSQRSGKVTASPSERAGSRVSEPSPNPISEGTGSRSRVLSACTGKSGIDATKSSELASPRLSGSRSQGPLSRSRVSSAHGSNSGRTIMLPSERAGSSTARSTSRSHAPSKSDSYISRPATGVSSVRMPPSTINTDSLPSTIAGSKLSDTRSGTSVNSSFSVHPDTGIPNMRDWTVRAQLDHYIIACADAEAEQEARGDPGFTALKRIATTMGCIDHQHHLEMDTILYGGNPAAALERLKECHTRNSGHMYAPGCCGAGAYLHDDEEAVTASIGESKTGSSGSYGSNKYGGSQTSSRYSSNDGRSRASSYRKGSRMSGTSAGGERGSGSRGRSSWRSQDGSRVPGMSGSGTSRMSCKTAPTSVWRGGKTESVLPSESASQI